MIKHSTQHGNSLALIVDKPILDLLRITPRTPLEINTDGRNLIISPVTGKEREKRVNGAMERVHMWFGKMLRALAD